MKFTVLIILCELFYTAVAKDGAPKCEGVHISGKFHKKHVITNGLNRPYQLAIHNDTIFFSYNIGANHTDTFEVGYLTKNDKIPTPLTAVKNGFATAVDEHSEIAYLGGSNGIHALNLKDKEIKQVVEKHDIWDMFFKEHLYFIAYPSQRLYKKSHNDSELVERIHEKVYQFVIDGDENVFITTADGVFQIKNGTTERIPFNGPKVFRSVEVNHDGVAHFTGQSAIYVPNEDDNTLEEIASIKNIFGITFDKEDHIIYSNPHEIIRLLPDTCK